jgi:hypothetical protein
MMRPTLVHFLPLALLDIVFNFFYQVINWQKAYISHKLRRLRAYMTVPLVLGSGVGELPVHGGRVTGALRQKMYIWSRKLAI